MAEPRVTINGKEAGYWAYGYNAFIVDVTPYIHHDGTPNDLEVRLTNLEESNRWYPGGGIYRPVTLVTTGETAFDQWGLCVRTLSIDGDKLLVEVRAPTGCRTSNDNETHNELGFHSPMPKAL